MATIKKMQAEKDSGEWESLSDQALQQVLATFHLLKFWFSSTIHLIGPVLPSVSHNAVLPGERVLSVGQLLASK